MQLIQIFFHNSICCFIQLIVEFWCILTQFFVILKRRRNVSRKIVQLNVVGGASILFAAYSVYGRISVRFSPEFIVRLLHCLHPNFFAKIVLMNSLGGATVLFAAYTAF